MRPTLANHSLGWGRLRVHGTSESAPREKAEGGVECVGSNLTFHLWFQTSGMGTTGQRMLQSILAHRHLQVRLSGGGPETSAADRPPPCDS